MSCLCRYQLPPATDIHRARDIPLGKNQLTQLDWLPQFPYSCNIQGLLLEFFVNHAQYLSFLPSTGIPLVIHQRNSSLSIDNEALNVPVGMQTLIGIRQVTRSRKKVFGTPDSKFLNATTTFGLKRYTSVWSSVWTALPTCAHSCATLRTRFAKCIREWSCPHSRSDRRINAPHDALPKNVPQKWMLMLPKSSMMLP